MYDIKRIIDVKNVGQALDVLAQEKNVTIIAGGTDVMIRMKERKLKNATLMSILDLKELKGIEYLKSGDISIKPSTSFETIYNNSIIREHLPALGEAVNQVGSPQIRNVATIGGNLCNGAVSADSVPILLALEASLELKSKNHTRVIPLRQFHTGPGKTVRSQDELLTNIIIPFESYDKSGAKYIKFGQRNAMEISTLGCAVNVRMDDDQEWIKKIRIAFGVAAPTPIRCYQLEKDLVGRVVDSDCISYVRKHILDELSPRNSWRASKELREQLIKELSTRALKEAVRQAKGDKNNENH